MNPKIKEDCKKVFSKVKAAEKITGLRLGPDDAYLITRGLRTLDVRLDRHSKNAKLVSKFLFKYKNIKLLYPYKKNSFNYKMWKKYYSGASGLMGLKIKSKNKNSVKKFVNSLLELVLDNPPGVAVVIKFNKFGLNNGLN